MVARNLLLWVAATDSTFEVQTVGEGKLLVGKCIFCKTKLVLGLDGEPSRGVSLEHILPRTQGGTNALENLALACRSCNGEKGSRHDPKKKRGVRATEIVTDLLERRRARWREPLAGLELQPLEDD